MVTSLDYFRSELPPGTSGSWVVERVVLAERDYDAAADPRPDCFKFRPGTYTCLRRGPTQYMTDLYDEWWTQRSAIGEALKRGGGVLVTGLGIGMVVEAMLRPPGSPVTKVTVIEAAADVVRLVAPYLVAKYQKRIEIVHADAFEWRPSPGSRFTVGWHDIWPNPYEERCTEEMLRLESAYSSYCDWQGSWPRDYLAASQNQV